MLPLKLLSVTDQVVNHLTAELARGQWMKTMPGKDRLAAELGVSRMTVEVALRRLERDGRLLGRGKRCKRLIIPPSEKAARPMRIALLLYERADIPRDYLIKLPFAFKNLGHTFDFAPKTMMELKMDPARIGRFVEQHQADAWIVMAGPREVLEWFSAQSRPAFALFGRREGLPVASIGPNCRVAIVAAVRHLVNLGHSRIVLLGRRERRWPEPGPTERTFLDELKAHGITVGRYNLPDWEETKEGFQKLLDSLFRVTPPTALFIDDYTLFIPTQQYLADRGLQVPQNISLVSTENQAGYAWCMKEVAHYRWDSHKVVPRILRWAEAVSRGHRDVRQTLIPAEFVPGGTIGPAPPP